MRFSYLYNNIPGLRHRVLAVLGAPLLARPWASRRLGRREIDPRILPSIENVLAVWRQRHAPRAVGLGQSSATPKGCMALALAFATGDFSACSGAAGAATADGTPGAFMRGAGLAWPLDASPPQASLPPGHVAIVLLPGADGRAMLPLLGRGHTGEVLAQHGAEGTQELLAVFGGLIEAPPAGGHAGFDRPWYLAIRRLAEQIIAEAGTAFVDPLLRASLGKRRPALVNQLNLDLVSQIGKAQDLVDAMAARQPDIVVLVGGHAPCLHLAKALVESGVAPARVFLTSGSWKPSSRAAFVTELRRNSPAPAAATGASGPDAQLAATIAHYRRRIRLPDMTGRAVIVIDQRDTREFRYSSAALALAAEATVSRKVVFLQPRNAYSRNVFKIAIRALVRFRGRARLALMPSLQSFPLNRDADAWADILAERARHASAVMAAPITWCGPVVEETVREFSARYLPQALALGEAVEDAFRRGPPAYAIFVPDTQPFTMASASGANAAGVPTLAAQTLLIGRSDRDCWPVSRYLACIDTSQRRLYEERFGIERANIVLAGSEDLASLQRAAAGRSQEAVSDARKSIIFVTQPLPGLMETALRWVVDAVKAMPKLELRVYAHPDETDAAVAAYMAIVGAGGDPERLRVVGRGTPTEAILGAEVVANVVSNVGYRAAVAGKKVLVVDPTSAGLPVRFDESGLAVAAASSLEVAERLRDLTTDGPVVEELARRRADYLALNPQFASGHVAARIISFLESVSTGQQAPMTATKVEW